MRIIIHLHEQDYLISVSPLFLFVLVIMIRHFLLLLTRIDQSINHNISNNNNNNNNVATITVVKTGIQRVLSQREALSSGPTAAIVVACLAVVAIPLIVWLIYRHRQTVRVAQEREAMESTDASNHAATDVAANRPNNKKEEAEEV